ncbi:MAG: cysteine desulfurase NifS, partial [cyanobacterium endosymbiont of Rhopalodia yunnanensis]
TTQVHEEVLTAMLPYLTLYYGNPSSMHTFGGQVGLAVQTSREQVASLLGAEPSEIVFTSCGTEGDNTAIHAALFAQPNKRHIITSKVEHPAVLNLCKNLECKDYTVTYLSVDDQGQLDISEFEASLTQNTALVTLMYANNETGVIFPIEQVGQLAKKYGAMFHVDAVQAVGKIPLNMKESTIDMLTLSGHKIHAPKGIGALYVRRGTRFSPLLIGGHQERGRRGGTENVPGIVALGKAAELAESYLIMETREKGLRDYLEQTILTTISDTVLNGHAVQRLPNTSNIGFKFVEGEAILLSLNQHGIYASSGSACTSGSLEPSHVLRAMGLPYALLHGSIRFSLSRFTTHEQVQKVLEVLPGIIDRLRALSAFTSDDVGWLIERKQTALAN